MKSVLHRVGPVLKNYINITGEKNVTTVLCDIHLLVLASGQITDRHDNLRPHKT